MANKMSTCKGCGKPIIWGETRSGKKIPLDPKPPMYSFEKEGAKQVIVRRNDIYVSHFATCSNANDFSASKSDIPKKKLKAVLDAIDEMWNKHERPKALNELRMLVFGIVSKKDN